MNCSARLNVAAQPHTVLIYDADCSFCERVAQLGRRTLPAMPETLGYQFADLDSYGLTEEQTRHAIFLVRPGAAPARGHLAVGAILLDQPRFGWRVLGGLLTTAPMSWAAAGAYWLIARNRHRMPGGTAACKIPTVPAA